MLATSLFGVIETAVIFAGIILIVAVIAFSIYAFEALTRGRAIIPWGQRQRVERARANKDIAEIRIEEEAAELKYLAMQPTRLAINKAIEEGELINLKDLLAGKKALPMRDVEDYEQEV